MHTDVGDRIARAVGLAVGVGLVLAIVIAVRPAGGHGGALPARLAVTAGQDGAVTTTPLAPEPLFRTSLRPGKRAGGQLRLLNQTGSALAVGLRAEASSTALDGLAHLRISTRGGKVLADNTLQVLRRGSEGTVRLRPGAGARLKVEAWLPADAETGYEGASVAVELVPEYGGAR